MTSINIAIVDCYFAQCSPHSRSRQPGRIVLVLFSFFIYTSWHRALFLYGHGKMREWIEKWICAYMKVREERERERERESMSVWKKD